MLKIIMPFRKKNFGFTLIELMIVVAIIGILAAIAYPSYRDYVLRSKIAEAFSALEAARTDMERFYQDKRTYVGAPCGSGQVVEAFDLTCTGVRNNSVFTITAKGKGMALGFSYTINQLNERYTTSVPAGSGYVACMTNSNGWMGRRGQSC